MRTCINDNEFFGLSERYTISLYNHTAYYLFFDALSSIGCSQFKPTVLFLKIFAFSNNSLTI